MRQPPVALTLVSRTPEDLELHERLKSLARARGCFLSTLLREVLTTFVEVEEEAAREASAR